MALHTSKVEDFSSQLTFTGSDVTSNIEFVPIEAKSVAPESYEIKARIRSTNDTLIITSPTAADQPKLHATTSTTDPTDELKLKLNTVTGAIDKDIAAQNIFSKSKERTMKKDWDEAKKDLEKNYGSEVGNGIRELFNVPLTNSDGNELTDEELNKRTWGKALDDIFTAGALNGEWGKWDDGEGGGWKGLLSSAAKWVVDEITDNSQKDWARSLIYLGSNESKYGQAQGNNKYGKKGRGSAAMSWGYRPNSPSLSDEEDTIKRLDKWIKEMSEGGEKSKIFHNHNTVADGGMGKYYADNKRPEDEKRESPKDIDQLGYLKSSESYVMSDDNSVKPSIGKPSDDPKKETQFNATIYNFINQIMNDPDADQNYFVAWFTYNSEGQDFLVEAEDLSGWNYFFYIDEIEANAIKLGDPQKINYLYESIYTMSKAALNGDTKFSFKISNDLYLSFRTYVLDICMPHLSTEDTETNPTKTMTVEGFTDNLDLHVAWHAGVGDDGKPQVAEIVFKSTDFVKMGSLTFDQAETSSSSSKIDGICRKILFRVFTSEPIEVVNPEEDWLKKTDDPGTPEDWDTNKDATKAKKQKEAEEEQKKKEEEEKKKKEEEEQKKKEEKEKKEQEEEEKKKKKEEEKKRKEEAKKQEKESKENLEKVREQNRKGRASMFAQNNNNGSASVGIKFSF